MSEAKHTPGPWVARRGHGAWWTISASNGPIGSVKGAASTYDVATDTTALLAVTELQANAHLIAAAPDMKEALDHPILRRIFAAIEDSGTREAERLWALCQQWADTRDAALAKAKGGAA